jgi:hypothetical protein
MKYVAWLIAVVGIVFGPIAAGVVCAQDALNRLIQNNWLQCAIVDGRIAFNGIRLGGTSQQATLRNAHQKETIRVHNENDQMVLNYERTSDDEQFLVELTNTGKRVILRRTPRGKSTAMAVEFQQIAEKNLQFTIGSVPKQQVFRAASLWTLLIAHPQECREHLIPLLELLRSHWCLMETASAAEEQLLQISKNDTPANHDHWAALVAQLADNNFTRREAADRALRIGGVRALAYLRQLDFKQLEVEQQFRIRRMLDRSNAKNTNDSAEQIAAALANEPAVWLAMLERPEAATRQTAASRLATLLGQPIPVDPKADPASQKDQREQLRARIEAQ